MGVDGFWAQQAASLADAGRYSRWRCLGASQSCLS